ncbi:hypothetical protein ITJ64_11350 [Herbiconiux sp. VKM Ac-1786]|uniref:hypothetical protein n=1 Tax=Herbiconiux sp. VKM Ac-1786 TaxID=2783824 RepID=UPI00188CA60C|nr:hypothetical protein [Herbiconiux sp. VKM Ac-1786]MBF4573114.1 hypothetical protein [Herbiconiux sp. VKM Ac-1786]
MSGWLRRNGIALGAVVVLVPTSLFVTFSSDWLGYWGQRATSPVVVERGADVDFGGAGWRVTEVQRIRSTELPPEAEAPAGTDAVVVSLEVSPEGPASPGAPASPGCLLDLVESRDGAPERSWSSDTGGGVDLDIDLDVPRGCDSERTGEYTMRAVFVVPSDAGDALQLHVEVGDQLPRYLSFRL